MTVPPCNPLTTEISTHSPSSTLKLKRSVSNGSSMRTVHRDTAGERDVLACAARLSPRSNRTAYAPVSPGWSAATSRRYGPPDASQQPAGVIRLGTTEFSAVPADGHSGAVEQAPGRLKGLPSARLTTLMSTTSASLAVNVKQSTSEAVSMLRVHRRVARQRRALSDDPVRQCGDRNNDPSHNVRLTSCTVRHNRSTEGAHFSLPPASVSSQ